MNPLYVILIVLIATIFIAGPRQIIRTSKAAWKERFGILLILIVCSCASPKSEFRQYNGPMTVNKIEGDSARLETPVFKIPYYVSSDGLKAGEKRFFMLWVGPTEVPGEFRAEVYRSFPIVAKEDIRRALKINRYVLKSNHENNGY